MGLGAEHPARCRWWGVHRLAAPRRGPARRRASMTTGCSSSRSRSISSWPAAARTGGRIFPVEAKTLWRRLDDAGLLAIEMEGDKRRRVVNAWISGASRRVLKLRADALAPASPSEKGEEREEREEPTQERGNSGEEPSPNSGNGAERGKESSTKTDDVEPVLPPLPPLPTPGRGGGAAAARPRGGGGVERVAGVLAEARAVGLEVRAEADRLVVRGPRLHEAIARQLLEQKPVVLALLAEEEAELGWRVAAMRPQVPLRGPIPVLVAREVCCHSRALSLLRRAACSGANRAVCAVRARGAGGARLGAGRH